jgi:putative ABC transport system ATP-binding protein
MKNMIIQTRDLTRTFLSAEVETTALRNINLQVEEGEFTAIMGPSGGGKSTLLYLLGLIDMPTSGSISFMGQDTLSLSEKQRTRLRRGSMAFVFQNFNLADELTVSENVELPLIFMGMKRRLRKERVAEVLDELKLGHRSRHYPQQLSGGQQQRVAFARAMVSRPKLLLADEPTGNLDSKNGTVILDLLTEHNRKGATVVMVTHSRKNASYAHRIIQLLDGALVN